MYSGEPLVQDYSGFFDFLKKKKKPQETTLVDLQIKAEREKIQSNVAKQKLAKLKAEAQQTEILGTKVNYSTIILAVVAIGAVGYAVWYQMKKGKRRRAK